MVIFEIPFVHFRFRMRRVVFCRSLCLTAEHLTTTNHRQFEIEDDCFFRPQEVWLIVSRNTNPMAQTIYKNHHTRPTNKLFHIGIHVKNNSGKTIKIGKNTLLSTLMQRVRIEKSFTVVTAKDLLRAEIDTQTFVNANMF
jgi:hypothetical protein